MAGKPYEGPVMTVAVKAEVDRLADEGLSGAQIARRLKVNPTLVYRHRSFKKEKVKPLPILTGAEQRSLQALLRKLEAFLSTPSGQGKAAEVRPQVEALRRVLEC